MEEIPISKRRKIEQTVVKILKDSDLETATEHSVRDAAARHLNTDLSDLPHKSLVRQVLESFLISTAQPPPLPQAEDDVISNGGSGERQLPLDDSNGRIICSLSGKRSVAVHGFSGKALVSIRDYADKDGKQFPTGRGISLTGRQWSVFRDSFPAVEEAIAKLEAKTRLATVEKESGTESSLVNNIASSGNVAIDQYQAGMSVSSFEETVDPRIQVREGKISGRETNDQRHKEPDVNHSMITPSFQEQTENRWTDNVPQNLTPVMTPRLDGKNYHSWVHLMEFLLNQLKVGYVLKIPCPSLPVEGMSFEETIKTKSGVQKWMDDEYICRHYILNSLCDNLFSQYSKKSCTAKELWEELGSVFNDDFGTVRSQVSKYIHFQMVDGVSVLDQVQELQRIMNNISAAGIWLDENFHVITIISKLPPSWKEYQEKLMCEDGILPYNVLMHKLKLEEESRNQFKKGSLGRKNLVPNSRTANGGSVVNNNRKDKKWSCYLCHKEGHIAKHCPDRKMEIHGKKENGTALPGNKDAVKEDE